MSSKYVYDYYVIDLPGDLVDPDHPEWAKLMGEYAITESRERSKLYCIPSLWTAQLQSGEPGDFTVYFKVCRKRNRKLRAKPDPAMVAASLEACKRGDYVTAEEYIEQRRG